MTCICVALNVPSGSITQIASFISGVGTIIAYIINNGIQAAAAIKARAQTDSAKLQLEAAKSVPANCAAYTCNGFTAPYQRSVDSPAEKVVESEQIHVQK